MCIAWVLIRCKNNTTGKPPPGSRNQWFKRFLYSLFTFVKGCSVPGYFMHVVACGQVLKAHTPWCLCMQLLADIWTMHTWQTDAEHSWKQAIRQIHKQKAMWVESNARRCQWSRCFMSEWAVGTNSILSQARIIYHYKHPKTKLHCTDHCVVSRKTQPRGQCESESMKN